MLLPLSVFFLFHLFVFRVPKQSAVAQVLANNASFFLTASERRTFTDITSTGEKEKQKTKRLCSSILVNLIYSSCSRINKYCLQKQMSSST